MHADDEGGKNAVTYYRVLDHAGGRASWVALLPVTGRTHQLRAHCAALGTPILGDGKYGGAAAQLPGGAAARRLQLHARSLEIPHPEGGMLRVTAHCRRICAASGNFSASPREAARSLRRAGRGRMKRVYKQATTRLAEGGWGVALDGRADAHPGRKELVVPSEKLAVAIAANGIRSGMRFVRRRCR